MQLRIKDARPSRSAARSRESLDVCARHGCQLIVNDYWREAIALGADYVHLGQEDLADADVPAIQAKGVRLGISTHSQDELEIALAADPDYVALGPIYETSSRRCNGRRRGWTASREWKARIGALPLVAIGGITPERADGVHGGRRRQPCRHYRFLHPCRPRGRMSPMAGVGARARRFDLLPQPPALAAARCMTDCDNGAC